MNILFLTQVLPYPLDAGPKIRAYYVLRYLAESGHSINLVSFIRDNDCAESLSHLRRYCEAIYTVPMQRSRYRDILMLLRAFVSRKPFLVTRDWLPAMALNIRNVVSSCPQFDVIHADQLWMAPYALLARQYSQPGYSPMTVLDQHNAVFNIPKRLADWEENRLKRSLLMMEARKLKKYERRVCRSFDSVVWVTREDRMALFADASEVPVSETVIPICLEVLKKDPVRPSSGNRRVTFVGGLHWPPNLQGILWFRKGVWPKIKCRLPGSVFTVIGRDPIPELAGGTDLSLEVTGYLADPTPFLVETAVFIVPLHAGGGMRVKILDAWSRGLPVVSTSIGAEGVCARHKENIYLADTADDFASAVLEIMKNPCLASKLAAGGRRTLKSYYDWRKVYRAWDPIYQCVSST